MHKKDTCIFVDRNVLPPYPEFTRRVIHSSLQIFGPRNYDLVDVEVEVLVLNAKIRSAADILEYLAATDILKKCLGLDDALAIQGKGLEIFRKVFGETRVVFFWKSAVLDKDRGIRVPYLFAGDKAVALCWTWLDVVVHFTYPTVHFGKLMDFG